ncbi:cyclopropane-fatty-acyl-phospholipid synthase [Aneurinibacillus sp. Ricciae_BoGa-3]|uniref:SAM-dependent methyltransferase n=1 Tax=Aneurinibacillus sp. Ricciae_BoGa-3 TaxID=3022697 RepID=UPI00233FEEE0|nr:cyclopropane-fatty-acyl-phospholipid synthase family protein [Aneurinibacillus sp. Ricciae_BoGa-3]WCK56598.1 cyclopropane-fatty-acyl-phospholipid synthase [Aneurinibacillus sp. Ricciae_BoGa-3]
MQNFLFHKFFSGIKGADFQVTYLDGTTEKYGTGDPRFTLVFRDKISLTELTKNPVLTFGEAYMNGAVDIDGSIEEIIRAANMNKSIFWSKTLSKLAVLPNLRKQKENVQYHYDLGNDFYSLWLDETMSYSCAYFRTPEDTLEQAQLQKIDHVLKKLQLKERETLLDIGSGWGWLIIRAAQQYGVKSTGVTLSEEQYKKTKERIAELGLENQVDVQLLDYRALAKTGRKFDKISSVGMFEHVEQAYYPDFMKSVQTMLKDQGLMLLHTITHPTEEPSDPWIEKYIFPGGYIPSFREIIQLLPEYDFHLIDAESLRLHYAKTLDNWAERFENHVETVKGMYGERFVRMWRLYLNAAAASFRLSGLNIHQILFSKGLNNNLEITRDYMYR